MNKGIWYAAGAYSFWGLFPIYFKWLQHVPALQVVSHRILWSFVILAGLVLHGTPWRTFRDRALNLAVLRVYALAAILIAVNWLVYIWAVNTGHIVETSLGYFITPLLNVFLGVLFFRERLRPWPWAALGLAGAGVLYLTLDSGVLLLPALAYLLYAERTGAAAFLHTGATYDALLVGSGLMTMLPLLMFASAARRIPLSLLGVLQYIAPTLQFLLGVLLYGEPFTQAQVIGFSLVWVALVIFSIEGFFAHRPQPVATPE